MRLEGGRGEAGLRIGHLSQVEVFRATCLERNRFRKTIKQILRGRKLKRFAKRFESLMSTKKKEPSASASRKMSTNQKLSEFLNKSEIQDEEADALDQEEKRARDRLRVTSLYGAGARFKTPKTKVCWKFHAFCLIALLRKNQRRSSLPSSS
jgi:hypothetical protein